MQKKFSVCALLFYVAAICMFVAVLIGRFEDGTTSTTCMCVGALFLCLGSVQLSLANMKAKEDKDTQAKSDEDAKAE